MSMPFILFHNENIYDFDNKPMAVHHKPSMYLSKYSNLVRDQWKSAKDEHPSWGFAELHVEQPEEFLRKNCGIRKKRGTKDHICDKTKKPPIPRPGEYTRGGQGGADFKEKNIKSVRCAEPRRPAPKFVDTRNGDAHRLDKSGLMPQYIFQPKFGKIPCYLVKMVSKMNEERAKREAEAQYQKEQEFQYITEEEREKLLKGLYNNWKEFHKRYQSMPVWIDTIPKKIRMTGYENELKRLEQYILFVESHKNIYIHNPVNNNNC